MVKSVRSRMRVEQDERAVREPVLEDLEGGAQLVHLELGRMVSMSLWNATNTARETCLRSRGRSGWGGA